MGLLRVRSQSQWRFKMLANVCPDIFWIREHFVTKSSLVMQQHEPEYHAKKKKKKIVLLFVIAIFKVKVTARVHMIQIWPFYCIFRTVDSLAIKLSLMIHHHKPDCPVKKWITAFTVKVTARAYTIKIWLFLLYLLTLWSVCSQTWFDSTAS